MLHSRRRRLAALAEAEAAGESFWTTKFDETVRNRIHHLFTDVCQSRHSYLECVEFARKLILREEGLMFLSFARYTPVDDFEIYLKDCLDDLVPTVIEATIIAVSHNNSTRFYTPRLLHGLSEIMREHRVAFEIVDKQMVEFSSRELHISLIAPALHLISNSSDWSAVESSYRDALKEISAGKPADAITDAGTALQQTLEMLGCEGNALGPLIKSARKKGLISSHDITVTDGIEKILHWASANRSERGDAHKVSDASIDDAWLMVHVVGAVILRLSRES